VDYGHHVVASVGPVVEIDDSILQAAPFKIPELQSPQRQAGHSLRVVPFHYGNRSYSIGAMTAIQEPVDPSGICPQLLKQRKQSTKRLGIGGPNRSKVISSIVVDSNQNYTKDDMTLPVSGIPPNQGSRSLREILHELSRRSLKWQAHRSCEACQGSAVPTR
jgi:hypothetical protein